MGEIKELVPHGKGKITGTNGDLFEGEFIDYKRHGRCKYINGGGECTSATQKEAKIVENMAFRFMNVYGRTNTSFTWVSPFKPEPTQQEIHRDEERRERQLDRQYYGGPGNLQNIGYGLGYQPHVHRPSQSPVTTGRAQQDLNLIANIVGPKIKVEMTEANQNTVNFYVHVPLRRYMKEILQYVNANTSRIYQGYYRAVELQEYSNAMFKLVLKTAI